VYLSSKSSCFTTCLSVTSVPEDAETQELDDISSLSKPETAVSGGSTTLDRLHSDNDHSAQTDPVLTAWNSAVGLGSSMGGEASRNQDHKPRRGGHRGLLYCKDAVSSLLIASFEEQFNK
jgi:hypothetical protein